jgi:hypothetical protein
VCLDLTNFISICGNIKRENIGTILFGTMHDAQSSYRRVGRAAMSKEITECMDCIS